jgi:hypothetical protein
MRHHRWVTTTVAVSSFMLFLTAASFIVASEAKQTQRSQSSPSTTGTGIIQVADEEASAPATGAPATGADDTQKGSPSLVPPTTLLDKDESRGILGTSVRSAANEDMGRVVDVIVDRSGTTRAAVIDFGGFLGVGSRKVAVDWSAMRFGAANGVSIDLTRDQVRTAPQYQEGKPIMVLGAAPELARSRFTARMPEQ